MYKQMRSFQWCLWDCTMEANQKRNVQTFLYYLTGEEYQIKMRIPIISLSMKRHSSVFGILYLRRKETTLSDGTQVNPYRCEVAYNDYEVVVEALDQEQLHSIKAWLDMPCVLYPQKKEIC